MATVLALSSEVARGHVGLAAIVPALQRFGHEVIRLPSVLLSNHPGHRHRAGLDVPPERLGEMLDALDENGWLGEVDAVLTGYLPTAAHVAFAVEMIDRVRARRPDALIACDPVLGDDPGGLYVAQHAAEATRDLLLPRAQFSSPNRFELSWLSGEPVGTPAEAVTAARRLGSETVLVTSVPVDAGRIANLLVTPADALASIVPLYAHVPHGTGDFMMAVALALSLQGASRAAVLGGAAASTAALIAASAGSDELKLVASAAEWHTAAPLAVTPV